MHPSGPEPDPETDPASPGALVRAVRERLARTATAAQACDAVVRSIAAVGLGLPSVYLERGGLLRCMSSLGYRQVLDGMPPHSGVIARAYRTGKGVLLDDVGAAPDFLEATPGIRSEACVPVVLDGVAIGVLNVESPSQLPATVPDVLTELAAMLADRVGQLGGAPRETRWQRLARYAASLSGLREAPAIEQACLEAATDLSQMSSALIATTGPDGILTVRATRGPLGAGLQSLHADTLAMIAGWVSSARSCYSVAPSGGGTPAPDALHAVGARSWAALGLDARGRVQGFLLTADAAQGVQVTDAVQLLEVLASQTASCLQAAAALDELRERAARDPLTGLGHHAAFGEALARVRQHPGSTPVAAVLIDVDGFKAVNDREGHQAGDAVLRALATQLADALREGDRLYRIGGDEFATVLAVASAEQALQLGERLRQAAAATGRTVSIGVAVGGSDHPEQLVARADTALYDVKRSGRDGVRLAKPIEA